MPFTVVQGLYSCEERTMAIWIPIGHGIRYRIHPTKTIGVGRNKRPLRYYTAVYKWKGKVVTDIYGWEGDVFKTEDQIISSVLKLRQNRSNHTPPFTRKEELETREAEINAQFQEEETKRLQLEQDKRSVLNMVFDAYCMTHAHKKSLPDEILYYNKWIRQDIGDKQLDNIVLLDLERIKKKMVSAGRAPRTIQYIKQLMRQLYNFASYHNLYSGDKPTDHFLKGQKLNNVRVRYLTIEEATILLEYLHTRSEQTYRMALLSLNTGMRFGEIAALKWQHILEENREIIILDPKGGESRRAYMTDAVVSMFQRMQRRSPNNLVFPARKKPGEVSETKMQYVSDTFMRAVDDLGLNDSISDRRMKVVFHTLRHTCASWLVNEGVALTIIAKALGHKTMAMTMRYSHTSDETYRNAMSTLDKQQNKAPKVVPISDKIGRKN